MYISSMSRNCGKKTYGCDTSESDVSDNLNNVLSDWIQTESFVTFEPFTVGFCRLRRENTFSARALSMCEFEEPLLSLLSLSSDDSDINLLAFLLVTFEDVEREDFIFEISV